MYSRAGRFASVTNCVTQRFHLPPLAPAESPENHDLRCAAPPFTWNGLVEAVAPTSTRTLALHHASFHQSFAILATTRGRAQYTLPNNPPTFRNLSSLEYQGDTHVTRNSPQNANSLPPTLTHQRRQNSESEGVGGGGKCPC